MKNKSIVIGILCALLLALPAVAMAAVYYLTDSTSGVGLGTVYTLNITGSGGSYHLTLKADTISAPDWYIEFWNLKVGDATSAAYVSKPSAYWNITLSSVSLSPNVGQFPQNQRAGGYVSGLSPSLNTLAEVQQGVNLNGASATWVFDIVSPNLKMEDLAFQVGYYSWDAGANNGEGAPVFGGRLSQTFGIPEPGTLILLGTGLLGLAFMGRSKFRK